MITQEQLISKLEYCEYTGIFRWKIKPMSRINIGDIAGASDKDGYIIIMIDGKNYRAHRLAWLYVTGEHPINLIDHKDGVKYHNWFDNLRPSNAVHNQQNIKKARCDNKSGSNIAGVSFRTAMKKWTVQFKVNKKGRYFGAFSTREEAEQVCLEMRRKHLAGNLL